MTTTHRHSITPRFQALLELPSQRLSRPLDLSTFRHALAIFLFLLLTCSPAYAATERDPFEKVNRVTFGFNVALERAVLKLLASGYDNYTPKVAKTQSGGMLLALYAMSQGRNSRNMVIRLAKKY